MIRTLRAIQWFAMAIGVTTLVAVIGLTTLG